MSYNKLKSLVANVETIETAMKIQVQGRQATAEEKEILSRYSGFGGIKEVLNIGTDKPIGGDMQEPIQRLQELINAYPHFTEPMRHNVIEGIKASVLTAFYTPKFLVDAVVRQIHATFSENGLKMRSFLEPSAGIGGFLPIAMSGTYDYAIEKDLISGMILSLLHENTLTRTAAFETIGEQGFEHTTFDVIASNIPFGNFRVFDAELWKKGGMYEQATKTIHNYFFVKAMELLNEGGLNHKGGVGKTTTTINLAAALRQKKKRVLAIDMDGQANLTESCGLSIEEEQTVYGAMRGEYPLPVIELENGLAVVPSCLDLSAAESELINEPGRELILKGLITKLLDSRKFDYILIDCPPSLGLLTLNALTTADFLIIPVQAQFLAMRGMAKITSVIEIVKERLNPNLSIGGIVITQFDKRKTLNKSVAEIINDSFCDKVFKTLVRDNVALAEAPIKGKNVFEYNKNCNGAKDYMALAQEVLKLK